PPGAPLLRAHRHGAPPPARAGPARRMSEPHLAVATPAGARRRLRPAVPDALAVALVGLALLALWELASWAYLTATVPPQFRAGVISGADPTVPAELRVLQMKLPYPHLVLAALLDPENVNQLWLAGLVTLKSAVLG